MFGLWKGIIVAKLSRFPKRISHCDDEGSGGQSLVELANATLEGEKAKIRTPMQYENLVGTLRQGSVNTYDGFRVVVQKQVNLNTVVSHFYWIGSQATQQPIYQYRVILPFDDNKVLNVATDMDFNVEGEAKIGFTEQISAKSNFAVCIFFFSLFLVFIIFIIQYNIYSLSFTSSFTS